MSAATRRAAIAAEGSRYPDLPGGEAKAMLVTASREEAVQWKRALDREIARRASITRRS
jgi:hypothetical protein